MNGIGFIIRDLSGWTPPGPLPRRRLRWLNPKEEAIKPEEQEFIENAKGRLTSTDLSECYGMSLQAICNIWRRSQTKASDE